MTKTLLSALFLVFCVLPAFAQDTLRAGNDSIKNESGLSGYVPYPDSLMTFSEYGTASWYGKDWKGRMTSSGQRFSPDSLTAAHKRLPFGTVVRVTNLSNDSVVYVKITDRLPKSSARSIDLTPHAAKSLNFYSKGLAKVKIEVTGYAPVYKSPKVPPKKKKKPVPKKQ